jgi:two-component sensor histidine kinase
MSNAGGVVHVSSSLDDENLSLIWKEEGGPEVPGDPEDEGFGGALTRQVILNQFNGKLERDWELSGLRLRIEIPLSRLISPSGKRQ